MRSVSAALKTTIATGLLGFSLALAQWVAPGTTFGAPSSLSYSQAMAYVTVQMNAAAVQRA
ncbi:MAG: hypothetical protein N2318_11230, partial [Meiothermus sp.]|nr:hypothetical protein [Meiothermus sp.]